MWTCGIKSFSTSHNFHSVLLLIITVTFQITTLLFYYFPLSGYVDSPELFDGKHTSELIRFGSIYLPYVTKIDFCFYTKAYFSLSVSFCSQVLEN